MGGNTRLEDRWCSVSRVTVMMLVGGAKRSVCVCFCGGERGIEKVRGKGLGMRSVNWSDLIRV